MKLYVYEYIEELTDRYHSGGGLMLITDKDPQEFYAKWVANSNANKSPEDAWKDDLPMPVLPEPTYVANTDATEAKAFVFENAGCC